MREVIFALLLLIVLTVAVRITIPSKTYEIHVGEDLIELDTKLDVEIREQLLILKEYND